MKKLFLYLIIFSFIFWTGFIISNSIFKNYTPSYVTTQDTTEITTGLTTEATEELSEATEEVMGEYPESDTSTQYIVGISNGYVTVYKNNINNVYEYTGINAINVQMNDGETYYKLCNKMYFNNIDELYSFLQSIAN